MEDILELEFRNDMSSGVADANFAQVDDIVLVGQDEHRQSSLRRQWHVTRVEELEKCREDTLTLELLVQLHFLSVNRAQSRLLFPSVNLHWTDCTDRWMDKQTTAVNA